MAASIVLRCSKTKGHPYGCPFVLELVMWLEHTTCWLRISCSTDWAIPAFPVFIPRADRCAFCAAARAPCHQRYKMIAHFFPAVNGRVSRRWSVFFFPSDYNTYIPAVHGGTSAIFLSPAPLTRPFSPYSRTWVLLKPCGFPSAYYARF